MTDKKPLPIGIEDYKRMIEKSYYYVDKTLLIKELLDQGGAVHLFTRPRRFGKTLALSMIKTFFEYEIDIDGTRKDNRHYFNNMKIVSAGNHYLSEIGKYPVIFLSLKSAKQPSYLMSYSQIKECIALEFKRHKYILNDTTILKSEKEKFQSIMEVKADDIAYSTALKFLSECLKQYHKENVIILLDEYDVPLETAYFKGFYQQMLDFIRSLFKSALKTNDSLEFAVITGCLRISRESIFTGLNNLKAVSILNNNYSEYFGFTDCEILQIAKDYHMEQKTAEIRNWYNGYLFGNTEVYNPWSVINYIDQLKANPDAFPKPYWSNVSSNYIIRELIEKADQGVKKIIEDLIAGKSIDIPVHEDITYEDIDTTQNNLWNFLFFTGYLKKTKEYLKEETIYLTLTIPNKEVLSIYRRTILEWFEQKLKQTDFTDFYHAILSGDTSIVESTIKKLLITSISYYDNAETFYHGFLLGLLSTIQDYHVESNREHGTGRPDIILIPLNEKQPVVIFELKKSQNYIQMDELCSEALEQIEQQSYDEQLLAEGYLNIIKYGICFCKKSCKVKVKK